MSDSSAAGAVPPRLPTLSFTLLSLVTTLLVTTVGAIAFVGATIQSRSVEALQERTIAATTLIIGFVMSSQVAPTRPLLEEMQGLAERGRLDVDDPSALGDYLVERLRYQPEVAWLTYSDEATGRFVGARRFAADGVILNVSEPAIIGGRPRELEVTVDGRHVPNAHALEGGYDPRGRGWYQQAAASRGLVWTEPFRFNEGRPGVTAALALRRPDTGELRGVFTVDFYLDRVTQYLTELSRGHSEVRSPFYAVLSRRGSAIASVSGAGPVQAASVLEAALAAAPSDLETLSLDVPRPFVFVDQDIVYSAQLRPFPVASGLEWVVLAAVPQDEFLEVVYENQRVALLVGLALLVLAIGVGGTIARQIAGPLRAVAEDLRRVGEFELSATLSPRSFVRETVVVSDAVDRMKASLRSFGHYVPIQVVNELLQSGQEARLGGESRRLTIFFSDIVGFTGISEQMEPDELVEHLAEYLDAMTEIIQEHQGVVDKFVGDGIMALFNAPRALPEHPAAACRAALRSQACLRELAERWRARGRPVLRARIGIHTGDAIVGNVGTPDRFDYTVMGDAVNLASRLEGLNKLYGTSILASQDVLDATENAFEWRTLDCVAVVGRASGTMISELLGERGAVAPAVLDARDRYEAGLEAYRAGRFGLAHEAFEAAHALTTGDRAALLLAARAEELQRDPPIAWDGVYHATTK